MSNWVDRLIDPFNAAVSFGALMTTSVASLSLCQIAPVDFSYGYRAVLALLIVLVVTLGYMTISSMMNDFYLKQRKYYYEQRKDFVIANKIEDLTPNLIDKIFDSMPDEDQRNELVKSLYEKYSN